MKYNIKRRSSEESSMGRFWASLWRRTVLTVVALALVAGVAGCAIEDLMTPFAGDIPFEVEQTAPPDMGAVDNSPTVPDVDVPLGDVDFSPLG